MAPTTLEELLDREAIRDRLYRYARGLDRMDRELLRDTYWPDAVDDHNNFQGLAWDFVEVALDRTSKMDATWLILGNILIELHGDTADVETYFDCYHRMVRDDGSRYDLNTCGRYLDRFEKRNGEWRVANRLVKHDWFRQFEDSEDWEKGVAGHTYAPSRKPVDPVYTRWASLG
jgi:hypothetical protein